LDSKISNKNKQQELVTVFLPTYNRKTWLRESIESILSQTYENTELLIVDDSTTDEIKKICDEYMDKGNIRYFHRKKTNRLSSAFRYFHRSKTKGLASAFNFCIEHMNGEWLKIMASDDLLLPDAIETFIQHAHSTNSKILYPDMIYIDEKGQSMGSRLQQSFENPDQFEEYFWLYQIVIAVTIFYHKSCFDVVGKFDENLIESFDYKWLLKAILLHDFKFQHIPKILFKFRLHSQQISFEHNEHHLSDVDEIRRTIGHELAIKRPEKWQSFMQSLKRYEKSQVPMSPLQHIPKSEKQTLNTKNEFKCKICEHFGGNPNNIYLLPEEDTTTCGQCHTIFSRKELEGQN